MGREIRKVPPRWQHPKNERGRQQPMVDQSFAAAFHEWLSGFDRIRGGTFLEFEEDYRDAAVPLVAWLNDYPPPDAAYYRPWTDEEATWLQVWETVSEGTPITPAFATAAELVDYLVAHGDAWDDQGYSRAAAEAFVEMKWAPSMVMTSDGQFATGIDAALLIKDKP